MATSLASQLQQLATPQTSILDQKRDRRSILFGPSEAAKYGLDVYFDIGQSGYEVLANTDPAFLPFAELMFGRGGQNFQRAVKTKEMNMRLDQEIEKFLLLLSPYLEKEASLRALEWLVYRFQINEMNQQSLLMCIFPYYESPLFTRVLQVMELGAEGAEWHWLSGCQKSARPLSKRTVFTRWAGNQAFRNFVACFLERMMKVHKSQRTPTVAGSFYISTVLGGIGITEVREEHLSSIVKSLPQCLASGHDHLISGCYLVLAHLSTKTHLSPTFIASLMEMLLKTHKSPQALTEQCLLCLLAVAHHQSLGELAPPTAAALGRPALMGYMERLARERSMAALLGPYTLGYVRHLVGKVTEERKTVINFTKFVERLFSLPLSSSDAAKVIWALYEAICTHHTALLSTPGLRAGLGAAVRALEATHPHGYAQATARLVEHQGDPRSGGEYKELLQALLLPASDSAPCLTHLFHPQDDLREAASKAFLRRLSKGGEQTGGSTALHIHNMLSDDHTPIPLMALHTPAALAALPAADLVPQCCQLLSKDGKKWKKVKEASLAALLGTVVDRYNKDTERMALSVCLPYTLLPKTSSDLILAKVVLRSQLAEQSAFLLALKKEVAPYLDSEGKAKDYCDKVWSAMPTVVSGLSATDLLALCGVLEGQADDCHVSRFKVMALALLHASLGVKGHLALKMAHKLTDLCLALLQDAQAPASPPPIDKDTWTTTQALTPHRLHACLAQVQDANLPISLLVTCVVQVCQVFRLPASCTNTPYWSPFMESEPGEGHLLLLVKVFKAALRLEAAGTTPGRDAVLLRVYKECLPDPKSQFFFMALIWGWQSSLPFSDIIDETLQIWTLALAKALLSSYAQGTTSLAWTLCTHQPLVPALLSALTSCEERVRQEAVECLRALGSVRGGSLAADSHADVIKVILGQAEELVADASQLATLLYCGGSSSANVCRMKQVTQCLLGVVVADKGHPPAHVRASLLFALTAATDLAVLLNLLPLAESLLDKIEKKKPRKDDEEETEEGKLDVASSLCLLYILQRYTAEATQVLETEAGWRVFEKAMGSARACLRVHEDCVAPQAILLQEVLSSKFLTSIKSEVMRSRIWSMLVTRVILSDDPQEAKRLRHALRQVTLDAEVIAAQIDDLELTPKVTSLHTARAKRMKMKEGERTQQQAWHRLRLMLETLTILGCLERPWLLVAPLSQCLQLTLTLDLTSTTLLQQQILSTLLHLLEKSMEEIGEEEVSRRVQVNVEVIVACVRTSLSHDTHRRALLILALCARIVPDAVLHNMMAIFTFMGTSLLRRDDAHSFKIIHHTIESIVPTLLQHQGEKKDKGQGAGVEVRLAQVCQVFVDALPDLPHHRRLPLFTQLATTVQANPNLWLLLALLADSHVMRGSGRGEVEEEERRSLPQVIQFSLALATQFPAATQVRACVKLMHLISTLPEDKETAKAQQQQQQQQIKKQRKMIIQEEKEEKMEVEEAQVISLASFRSLHQLLYFKYTVTGLVAYLLASDKFVGKVYEVENKVKKVKVLQDLYQQLLEVTLCFLQAVTTACDHHKDKPAGRHFTSLQRKVVEVLEGLVALLPPPSLLQVCQGLLTSPVALVRCRAAELISAKLQPHLDYFRTEDTQALQNALQALCCSAVNKQEALESRQTYLFCLQLLTRHLSQSTPPPPSLQLVLTTAVDVVCDDKEEPRVVTQGLLVAAEAVAALQMEAVGCLGRLMPALTKMLVTASATTSAVVSSTATTTAAAAATAATTQLLATLTALHKVIESLPQLLSPYLKEVIKQVCCIQTGEESTTTTTGKESKVVGKLLAVRESLVKRVEPRILVPRLTKTFHSLLRGREDRGCIGGDLGPLHSLMTMVGWLVGELAPQALPTHCPALLELLTEALDLRTHKGDSREVQVVEEATFASLSRLLLRLPEQDNISIFSSLVSWAGPLFLTLAATPAATPPTPARLISFYRFANHLAGTYKVLFLAAHLAEALLAPTVALLNRLNDTAAPPVFGKGKAAAQHTCTLLEAVLDTLTKTFTYDSVGFVTTERFGFLCAPLTDLLDNLVGGTEAYRRRVRVHLSPCLTHLARAAGDDSLWRDLAAQVLMRLRDEDRPEVVLGALEVFGSLVDTLGEDLLRPLLADIIPPITEALESTNPEVESATRTLFAKMEEVLGDQMRVYLDH